MSRVSEKDFVFVQILGVVKTSVESSISCVVDGEFVVVFSVVIAVVEVVACVVVVVVVVGAAAGASVPESDS